MNLSLARLFVVVVAVNVIVAAGGCLTFEQALRENRGYEACVMAREERDLQPRFAAWLAQHTEIDAQLVPHDEVAAALGASVVDYGQAIGVYRLRATIPGGEASVTPHDGVDEAGLLKQLEPLVVPAPATPPGPLRLLTMNAESLEPRSGGWFDRFLSVGFDVGLGVGGAVGGIVGGTISGLVGGTVGFLRGIFGDSSSSTEDTTVKLPAVVVLPASRSSDVDALLEYKERETVVAARQQLHAEALAAATREYNRRTTLLEQLRRVRVGWTPARIPPSLQAFLAQDVAAPGERAVEVYARFSNGDQPDCVDSFKTTIAFARAKPPPLMPPTPNQATISLDAGAPSWARTTTTVTTDLRGAARATTKSKDLACVLETKARAKDKDGSPPDLVVRVTVGRATPRGQSFALGTDVKKVAFVAPGVDFVPGERLRLSLASAGGSGRDLGAVVRDHDGQLPITLENDAFIATCTEADENALVVARAAAQDAAAVDLDVLAAALAAHDSAATNDDPAHAGEVEAIVAARQAARRATAQLAMLSGWKAQTTTTALARLRAVDPVEAVQ